MYRAYKNSQPQKQQNQQPSSQQQQQPDVGAEYKLTYFPTRGRAELIRLIFAQANLPYQDVRIDFTEWQKLKDKTPWGGLPILEINGQILSQSISIARFVARETGLDGRTPEEKAECDAIVDTAVEMNEELMGQIGYAHFIGDYDKEEQSRQNVQEQTIPKIFPNLEKLLAGNSYFVGDQVTWADLSVFDMCDKIRDMAGLPHALNDYPTLRAHYNRVASLPNIENWIQKRPDTDIHNITPPKMYRLTMFDMMGRAELIRLIFAQANILYIDNRVDPIVSDIHLENLPKLDFNGQELGNSVLECTKLIAKETGLDGQNDEERSSCDRVVDVVMEVVEIMSKLETALITGNKDQQEEEFKNVKDSISEVYPKLETTLGSKEFFVGDQVTIADLAVFDTSDRLMNCFNISNLLEPYPQLLTHYNMIQNLPNIKAWIQRRPKDNSTYNLETKPKYKLTYFPIKFRAEPIRLLFAQGGLDFEDNRIGEEWTKLKPETPWGSLPILEVDGQVLSQSMAIARFVAREAGLDGADNEERLLCDSVVDAANEVCEVISEIAHAIFFKSDSPSLEITAKEKLKEQTVPQVFGNLEKHLEDNKQYFVGNKVTWADIMVFDMIDKVQTLGGYPEALLNYPSLSSHYQRVGELPRIKAWLDKRPNTDVHHLRPEKPAKYKLTHLDMRFGAELIRLIFAQAKEDFQDIRLSKEQWSDKKSESPDYKLPSLEVDDQVITECVLIARFVAEQTGLAGQNEEESKMCESICDTVSEVTEILTEIMETDQESRIKELKTRLSDEVVPKVYGTLQSHLHSNNSQFFVGDQVTWADLCVYDMCENVDSIGGLKDVLSGYSKLLAHFYTIGELPNIQTWLKKRPETQH